MLTPYSSAMSNKQKVTHRITFVSFLLPLQKSSENGRIYTWESSCVKKELLTLVHFGHIQLKHSNNQKIWMHGPDSSSTVSNVKE